MNYARRIAILQLVHYTLRWPSIATEEERRELVDGGFAYEEEDGFGDIACFLTSLGELEIGYPETNNKGDK